MDRPERRVVVTGLGLVTPVGLDVESTWEALREGRGGVGPITLFDARHVSDADRRRGEGFPARALPAEATRRGGKTTGGIRSSHWRRRRRRSSNQVCWNTREGTRRGSEFTSGRAKASRIFPGSST